MLVWRNASHHKYANLFVNPVTDEIAPGYSVVIKRPIDLKSIKSKVDNGQVIALCEKIKNIILSPLHLQLSQRQQFIGAQFIGANLLTSLNINPKATRDRPM